MYQIINSHERLMISDLMFSVPQTFRKNAVGYFNSNSNIIFLISLNINKPFAKRITYSAL